MSAYVPKGQENAINYDSKWVSKKEINEVPTQERQAPNRVGNKSMKPANDWGGRQGTGGVTNPPPDVNPMVSQPKGSQGAPKVAKAGQVNNARPDKVLVSQPPKKYTPTNLGFLKDNESKSWKS